MWQLQLKRQKSLAFCLLHKYSSYLKTLLPLQLEHCWFFFNNKHMWWSPSQQMTSSTSQMPPSSFTADETFNNSVGFINRANITTGRKSGRLQALASKATTPFVSPAQGTVQPREDTCEGPAQAECGATMCLESFQWHFLVWHGLRKRAPAPLGLFQSVQDELAGVNESLHAVNEARFWPRVHLWPGFIHTFLLETPKDLWEVAITNKYNFFHHCYLEIYLLGASSVNVFLWVRCESI